MVPSSSAGSKSQAWIIDEIDRLYELYAIDPQDAEARLLRRLVGRGITALGAAMRGLPWAA